MTPETHARKQSRRYAAALSHLDANPRHKQAAHTNGVTVRTERRWRTPAEAQGSPAEMFARYVATAQDPERLEVYAEVTKEQARLRGMTNAALVAEIHALHVEDAHGEGLDNATRAKRGISFSERAVVCQRDATHDIKLAARYQECAARGLSEGDVFGK